MVLSAPPGCAEGCILRLGRCADRANACASAATDALICINYIFAVAFADRSNRAFAGTSTAGNAVIGNFVCHCSDLLKIWFNNIVTYFLKNATVSSKKVFILRRILFRCSENLPFRHPNHRLRVVSRGKERSHPRACIA